MKSGDLLSRENMILGSSWHVTASFNGYEGFTGKNIVTQIRVGRNFQVIDFSKASNNYPLNSARLKVRLLEDGYECWLSSDEVLGNASKLDCWKPTIFNRNDIEERLPKILDWLHDASKLPNKYLWGGTIGPNFDCSGLVQTAFSSQGIWLPRDAYQQEDFCQKVDIDLKSYELICPGDLLFFGIGKRADHVGIYISHGRYIHSSGISHGLNGIGISSIYENESISSYYRSKFRSIGRVVRSHDGTKLY
tara:strand:- start:1935 stop:2681 length:747 start_codon:yes stop_codon:yes gene_type:complete